jgi:cobyrinic acid a,c-diamide synthase
MIWLGGGYPELTPAPFCQQAHAGRIRPAAHRRGVAIYAECGGLMYLGSTLRDAAGDIHAMADMIPGTARWGNV